MGDPDFQISNPEASAPHVRRDLLKIQVTTTGDDISHVNRVHVSTIALIWFPIRITAGDPARHPSWPQKECQAPPSAHEGGFGFRPLSSWPHGFGFSKGKTMTFEMTMFINFSKSDNPVQTSAGQLVPARPRHQPDNWIVLKYGKIPHSTYRLR